MVRLTKGEHGYNFIWEILYRINPAGFGGRRGIHLRPNLESERFNEIEGELISQITFPSEVVFGIKP